MFDFWKEVIINDDSRVDNVDGKLRVERCADYDPAYIVDEKTVYKTLPTKGVNAVIALEGLVGTGDALRRAQFNIGIVGGQDSEFARPWSNFAKTFVVEYSSLDELVAAIKEACPTHIGLVEDIVMNEGGKTIKTANLKLADKKFVLNPVVVEKYVAATTNAPETWETEMEVKATTPNIVPAGTGEWILENLRFPTHVNTRVASPNADEMPDAGAEYVQYAFEYAVPKRGFHGQGAVGQSVTSVTHHIFYVKSGKAATKFDSVLTALSITPTVINPGASTETIADDTYYSTVDGEYHNVVVKA